MENKQITFEEARTELRLERALLVLHRLAGIPTDDLAEISATTSGIMGYFGSLDEIMETHTLHCMLYALLNRNETETAYDGSHFNPNQVAVGIVQNLRELFADADQYSDTALLIKVFSVYGEFFRIPECDGEQKAEA